MRISSAFTSVLAVVAIAFGSAALAQSTTTATATSEDDGPLAGAAMAQAAVALLDRRMARPPSERVSLVIRHEARCIAVFPEIVKIGLVVAGKSGNGLVTCRRPETGQWGVPVHYRVSGASIGLQAGAQTSSLILMVVDDEGVQKLLAERIELSGDVAVTAGPLGAEGGLKPGASILSYSGSKGVFAGVDVGGTTISFDKAANAKAYGHDQDVKTMLFRQDVAQGALKAFRDKLNAYAPPK